MHRRVHQKSSKGSSFWLFFLNGQLNPKFDWTQEVHNDSFCSKRSNSVEVNRLQRDNKAYTLVQLKKCRLWVRTAIETRDVPGGVARAARMCPVLHPAPLPNSASCTTFLFYLQMMDRALALPTVSGALFCDWFTRNVRYRDLFFNRYSSVCNDCAVGRCREQAATRSGACQSHCFRTLTVRQAAETLPAAAAQSLTFALPVVMEMRLTAIPPGSTLDLFVLFLWVRSKPLCFNRFSHSAFISQPRFKVDFTYVNGT